MGKVASRFRRRNRRHRSNDEQHHQSVPDLSRPTEFKKYDQKRKGTRRPDRFSKSETDLRYVEIEETQLHSRHVDDSMSNSSRSAPPANIEYKNSSYQKIIVVAIDIGSSYSGYAYCTSKDFLADRSNIYSRTWTCENGQYYKTATAVLFKPDGSFYKFGFDAEQCYKESKTDHTDNKSDWYFFRNFKMVLYESKMNLNKDLTLKDLQGKEMKALKVFSSCIQFLKDDFLLNFQSDDYSNNDIHWVITVPAIWDMRAKQFMKDAAAEAGITGEQLSLALEPEAASLYCRQVPLLTKLSGKNNTDAEIKDGSSYMVLDQGGGTIDITVHEILSDNFLKEVYQANGGDWGGNSVNRKFEQFLENLFTKDVVDDVKSSQPAEYADIINEFERKKRGFPRDHLSGSEENNSDIKFRISPAFKKTYEKIHSTAKCDIPIRFGKLSISIADYEEFFEESINHIVAHISSLLEHPFLEDVKVILAVGGYSESTLLMNRIRERFHDMKIIVPNNPGVAVLKGAVLFGFEPSAVKTRISRYTYGIKVEREITENKSRDFRKIRKDLQSGKRFATDVFEKLVSIGDHIEVGELQPPTEYEPLSRQQKIASLEFYATEDGDPTEVSDDGCIEIGTLEVDLSERKGSDGCLKLQINAGGTEISAVVTEDKTGKQFQAHFCLP